MSIGNISEARILALVFQAATWAGIADNAAVPDTVLNIALHGADPGKAGDQSTAEVTYTSYSRVAVARSPAGWTLTNATTSPDTPASVSPAGFIQFPVSTGGPPTDTAPFFSIGGSDNAIIFLGSVVPPVPLFAGVSPRLTTNTSITID
jgi:hypothetical protein